jgi:hypothetical protein
MLRVHISTEMNLNSIIKKNKCGFISSSCTPKIQSCFMVCVIEISYADAHAGVLLSFVLMTKIIGHNRCVYNNYFKVKAKAVSLHAMQAQRGGRSIALPIVDPGCFMPRKVTQYPWEDGWRLRGDLDEAQKSCPYRDSNAGLSSP